VITDERKRQLDQEAPGKFVAMMGAEGIKELLKKIDVESLGEEIREKMKTEASQQKKLKFAKRLRVVESFRKSGNKPEWMILDVIPVIPPELRPLVPLDGGRFATSDLNDLYRRVINRNNRLKKLIELHAPDVIVRNEKRMLQEAVDALFDNGRRGRVLRGANNRPLKSLSDTLKGKQGRFRQNLLGKRVDYSGRSVIVVGPELRLNQCGLPKKMALELFKPFIYHRLEQRGHCTTIKQAKELVEQQDPVVWDILEEVIKDHPILLNRAPTLHRLGIQAFEPVLVEGKAIKIHPLVCTAFNADFDGDQMAVHIPLSPEAQIEASTLMLSSNNILSPAHGSPITVPTQDMVLGCYYLTKARPGAKGEGRTFASTDDVLIALEMGEVETLTPIKLRYTGRVIDLVHAFDNQNILHTEPIEFIKQYMETTVGRVIMNDHLPQEMPFINGLLKKKGLAQLVQYCYLKFGLHVTVQMLDEVKALGFLYATRAGISIGIDDMVVPGEKAGLVRDAEKEVVVVESQYQDGAITHGERYNKIIEIWSKVTERVSDEMMKSMEEDDRTGRYLNPIYIMADSGARGSKQQIRQLSGMRGLMAKPSGEIIETPITANFREGLNVLQYFISTHGARKGLADTALKTADSGYLTRRLVDVAQDVIVSENDCGTGEGIYVEPIIESGEIIENLRDRIVGRVALEDQRDYEGNLIVAVNHEITEDLAASIQAAGIERVKIRSVLTCESKRGVCVACYGRNLATGRMVERGEAVGVIAAQSIGEPGTQLTMRTFHIGGTASRINEQSKQDARSGGFARYIGIQTVRSKAGDLIAMNRNGKIAIDDDKGREKERYEVNYGARVLVEDGAPVKSNQVLLEWDPYTFSILTEVSGVVHFKDLIDGLTLHEQVDEVTGMSQLVVMDSLEEKRQPQVSVRPEGATGSRSEAKKYLMPTHAHLMVRDLEEVHAGDVIAKIPRETTKTKDITGGLPRVVELFEARKPRETAIIAEINGVVKYGEVAKGQRKIYVMGDDGEQREYSLPRGVHINVQEGERVKAGEPLMDGPRDPHDILAVLGEKELQKYLVNEIQEVYRLQGVNINDKHLETISRQMMRWVKVEDIGDTEFLPEEIVDKFKFRSENLKVSEAGGRPAQGKAMLLGITKASLSTDSFISAASFQETTRVLTEAAINGKVDYLRGLKENVIMGRLVPAGTGMEYYRRVKIAGEDVVEEPVAEPAIDAIPGYDEETRLQYAGGLPEDTVAEEPLAE
jgi:DNA-directed RNA polymerase subunit beta'